MASDTVLTSMPPSMLTAPTWPKPKLKGNDTRWCFPTLLVRTQWAMANTHCMPDSPHAVDYLHILTLCMSHRPSHASHIPLPVSRWRYLLRQHLDQATMCSKLGLEVMFLGYQLLYDSSNDLPLWEGHFTGASIPAPHASTTLVLIIALSYHASNASTNLGIIFLSFLLSSYHTSNLEHNQLWQTLTICLQDRCMAVGTTPFWREGCDSEHSFSIETLRKRGTRGL